LGGREINGQRALELRKIGDGRLAQKLLLLPASSLGIAGDGAGPQ